MNTQSDITATITLARSDQDGRKGAIHPGAFACIMAVDGQQHDVRISLDVPLAPGEGREVGMAFLDPLVALAHVRAGMAFTLRDWREIGAGTVLMVHNKVVSRQPSTSVRFAT